jgi:hypothetical protein
MGRSSAFPEDAVGRMGVDWLSGGDEQGDDR